MPCDPVRTRISGTNGGNLTHVMSWLRRTISFSIPHPSRPSGSSAHLLRSGIKARRVCCPRVAHAACNPQGLGNTSYSAAHRQPTARPRSHLLRLSSGMVSVLVAPASPSASQRSSRDLRAARVIGVHTTCSLANRLQRRTTAPRDAPSGGCSVSQRRRTLCLDRAGSPLLDGAQHVKWSTS
jgi:hypothetical protein